MEFKLLTFSESNTSVQLSVFNGQLNSECMAVIAIDQQRLSFENQLQSVIDTFNNLVQTELVGYKPVFLRFFVSDAANQFELVANEANKLNCAVSIIEQTPLNGSKIALWAYLQTNVEVLNNNGLVTVKNGKYTHYWATALRNVQGDSYQQMHDIFLQYISKLVDSNLSLANNCIRTWIFVQNIDRNYAGIVTARNHIFDTQALSPDTHFIASTGIQGRTETHNSLVTMDAYAVGGVAPHQIQFLYAPTHLNPTYEYGVGFERGTCVWYDDHRQVFISGTASINNKGEVVHVGNIELQANRMIENVEKLLDEAKCTFDDVAQMIVYLRDVADYSTVADIFNARFPNTPKVIVLAPVCRPTWLIEMECIATAK